MILPHVICGAYGTGRPCLSLRFGWVRALVRRAGGGGRRRPEAPRGSSSAHVKVLNYMGSRQAQVGGRVYGTSGAAAQPPAQHAIILPQPRARARRAGTPAAFPIDITQSAPRLRAAPRARAGLRDRRPGLARRVRTQPGRARAPARRESATRQFAPARRMQCVPASQSTQFHGKLTGNGPSGNEIDGLENRCSYSTYSKVQKW